MSDRLLLYVRVSNASDFFPPDGMAVYVPRRGWPRPSCPGPRPAPRSSDPPLLRRTTTVVWNRRHVANRPHLETRRSQRLDRGLAAAARPLHPHVNPLHPEVHRLPANLLRGHRRRERRRLLRPLEAGPPCAPPRDHGTGHVRDRDQRVVERRLDVRNALRIYLPPRTLGPRLGLRHASSSLAGLLLRRLLLAGDRATRPLVRPRVRMRPLPPHRQAPPVPQAPVAADVHQPLHVHRHLGPQRALDLVLVLDDAPQPVHLVVRELVHSPVGIHARLRKDLRRR